MSFQTFYRLSEKSIQMIVHWIKNLMVCKHYERFPPELIPKFLKILIYNTQVLRKL